MRRNNVFYRVALLLTMALSASVMCCSKAPQDEGGNNKPQPGPSEEIAFEKCIAIGDQKTRSFMILDGKTFNPVWTWKASSDFIPASRLRWFNNPSEVKPVMDNTHILFTCSGGAVGLIRIKDSKLVWYANAGVNPHSAELLPDGNVVSVSSTDAKVSIFNPDSETGYEECLATYNWPSAHALIWDKERQLLYGNYASTVSAYKYNFDKQSPKLTKSGVVVQIPQGENCVHDLYFVNGEPDCVWMTTNEAVSKLNVVTGELKRINTFYAVKSVSNDPEGNMLMQMPTEEWWSDSMINREGVVVFTLPGTRIYKGRYMYKNTFSY